LARRHSFSQLVELVFAVVVAVTLKEFALPLFFGYYCFAPPCNRLRLRLLGWAGWLPAPAATSVEPVKDVR
jgi:hypothetical protein